MIINQIKFNPSDYNMEFYVTLGSQKIKLDIQYNERQDRFYASIYDTLDNPIVLGVKLESFTNVLSKQRYKLTENNNSLLLVLSSNLTESVNGTLQNWIDGKLQLVTMEVTDD